MSYIFQLLFLEWKQAHLTSKLIALRFYFVYYLPKNFRARTKLQKTWCLLQRFWCPARDMFSFNSSRLHVSKMGVSTWLPIKDKKSRERYLIKLIPSAVVASQIQFCLLIRLRSNKITRQIRACTAYVWLLSEQSQCAETLP